MIRTIYVKAKSKKDINALLEAGKTVTGIEHNMGRETPHDLTSLNNGDVIKIWEKESFGSPVAKSYGNWNAKTGRVK